MRGLVHKATVAWLVAASVLLGVRVAGAATTERKNDGFTDGSSAGFQGGFASGEQGASTLGPVNETFTVSKIRLLYGPDDAADTVTLNVYEDTGGADPGAILYTGDIQITPATDAMSEVDLSAENVTMVGGGSIRVAFQFSHTGYPCIARDDDGSITPGRNWIYTNGSWVLSGSQGLIGDWIIRADAVTGGGTGGSGAGGGTGGSGAGGSGTGGSGAGTTVCTPGDTQPCVGPGACQGGQSCLASGMGWDTCQCAAAQNPASTDTSSGCSLSGNEPGRGGPLGLGVLGVGLGLARLRRRARR